MIVYFSSIQELDRSNALWQRWQELPRAMVERFHRFRMKKDAALFLLAKMLTQYALKSFDQNCDLHSIRQGSHGKPYASPYFDFNISHSGELAACVVYNREIGIDLEKVKEIQIEEFRTFCSKKEWEFICDAPDRTQALYTVWTRKEAVLKAAGIGIFCDTKSFNALESTIVLNGRRYEVMPVNLADGYVAHLATVCATSENEFVKGITTYYCDAKDLLQR